MHGALRSVSAEVKRDVRKRMLPKLGVVLHFVYCDFPIDFETAEVGCDKQYTRAALAPMQPFTSLGIYRIEETKE